MGYMCSYIAVKGVATATLLEAVGLEPTASPLQVLPCTREVNFCYRERPNGWTVLFSEDIEWASPERILALSHLGPAVGCQFEDKVEMTSLAIGADRGVELWRVFHNSRPEHLLDVSGDPPADLPAIRDRYSKEQEEEPDADFMHEIPMALMQAVCGYRPDEDMDEEMFLALKPVGTDDDMAAYGSRPWRRLRGEDGAPAPGFFTSLFNLFKRK